MPIRGVLKMIAIPNMNKPKECWECPCINDSDCQALELLAGDSRSYEVPFHGVRPNCPLIEIVTCKDCRNYETYALSNDMPTVCGFTIIESEESDEHNT